MTLVDAIDVRRSSKTLDEVVGLLYGVQSLAGDAKTLAHQCNGCSLYIPVCPRNINPRRVLILANTVGSRVVSEAPQLFCKMARAMWGLLHVHDGMLGIGQNVVHLLAEISGLTIVETISEPGYICGGSGADRSPVLKKLNERRRLPVLRGIMWMRS